MDQELDRIKQKIQKLLNLAEKAANEHEAANAMAKARALMDKYELSQFDTLDMGGVDVKFTRALATRFFAAIPEYLRFLPVAIAQLNDCQTQMVWGEVTYKKKPGERYKMGKAIEFRGMVNDVELAVDMFTRLIGAVNRLCAEYFERQGYVGKYPVGLGTKYKTGAIISLAARIEELTKERANLKTSNGTGLMVVKGAAVAEYFGDVEYGRSVPRAAKNLDDEESMAFHSGREDANKINIQEELESK